MLWWCLSAADVSKTKDMILISELKLILPNKRSLKVRRWNAWKVINI